ANVLPAAAGVAATPITAIGTRYWFNEKWGLDAGLGLLIAHVSPPGGGATTFGFGVVGGLPYALGVHKHITTFVEPALDFFVVSPPVGSTGFQLDVLGSMGFEWQLGFHWLETPTLALIFKLGAGLHVTNNVVAQSTSTVVFQTENQSGFGSVIQG